MAWFQARLQSALEVLCNLVCILPTGSKGWFSNQIFHRYEPHLAATICNE